MPITTQKTIFIQYSAGSSIKILIPSEKVTGLTNEWLLNETIKRLKRNFPKETNFDNIVALQTINQKYAIDHLLCSPNKPISVLDGGITLKPFYKQPIEQISDEDTTKVNLNHFIIETMLGYGAFSHVYLVRKKDTGVLYALKQIKKNNSTSESLTKMITRERQAMLDITSPYVITLRYSFQTNNYCYFVQDFIPGGDLYKIISQKKLTESEVRFYVAETILGLNAIHKENYIYRDLKPENLLLTCDGHICITDLGLAKKASNGENYSICGTFDILAPEILKGSGYNYAVDYYNIGTLAFELATGRVPVFIETNHILQEESNPCMASLSEDLKDFIKKLLQPSPQNRLGSKKGLNEICSHSWMSSINMLQLNLRKVRPPFVLDPNSMSFKSKKAIPANIDTIEGLIQLQVDGTIPNFSFYGFGNSSMPKKPNSNLQQQNKRDDGQDAQGIKAKNDIAIVSIKKNLPKSEKNFSGDDEEDTIVPETNESIAIKFESYKPESTKSMKKLKKFSSKSGKIEIDIQISNLV